MLLDIQTSQITGLSDENRWSQTFAESNIIIALELTSDGTFSAKEQGNEFLLRLADLLKKRQPQDKEIFKRLIIQFISATIFLNRIESLIVGFLKENTLFLFCKESGCAVIKRGQLWSEVLKGDGLVTGNIQEKDILIFETKSFARLITNEMVITRLFQDQDPSLVGEKLGAVLHNFDDSKGAAAIFAMFKKNEQAELVKDNQQEILPPENIDELPKAGIQLNHDLTSIQQPNIQKISPQEKIPQTQAKQSIFTKAKNLIKSIKIPFPRLVVFRKRGDYLSSERIAYKQSLFSQLFSTSKKKVLMAALSLVVVLLSTFVFARNDSINKKNISDTQANLERIKTQVEEAEALVDLNNTRSRTLLSQAVSDISSINENLKKGSKEKIVADDLLVKAENLLNAVSKIYKVDPSIFVDLTVVKEGAEAQNFSLYQNLLAVLDNKNTSVISVNLENQKAEIVGGGNKTPSPKLIASHGKNIFILTSEGIVKIDTNSKSQQIIVKDIKNLTNPVDMVGYGGNIYILDSTTNKIWKHVAISDGFSSASTYLGIDESIPLEVISMAIDGSVWVLGSSSVIKYTKGKEEPITLEQIEVPFNNPSQIFTDDESQYLYILDRNNNRVVVFDKEGKYYSQYVWEQMGTVSDIVANEAEKKLLLLSQGAIYEVTLNIEEKESE